MKNLKIKKQENEKGITLIALVVTIIVLIILAGISINLVLGDNGIITKAREAKNKYLKSANEEQVGLYELDKTIEDNISNKEYYVCYFEKALILIKNGISLKDVKSEEELISYITNFQNAYMIETNQERVDISSHIRSQEINGKLVSSLLFDNPDACGRNIKVILVKDGTEYSVDINIPEYEVHIWKGMSYTEDDITRNYIEVGLFSNREEKYESIQKAYIAYENQRIEITESIDNNFINTYQLFNDAILEKNNTIEVYKIILVKDGNEYELLWDNPYFEFYGLRLNDNGRGYSLSLENGNGKKIDILESYRPKMKVEGVSEEIDLTSALTKDIKDYYYINFGNLENAESYDGLNATVYITVNGKNIMWQGVIYTVQQMQ